MQVTPITAEYLRECLDYDQDTGVFTWKHRPVSHFNSEQGWRVFNSGYAGKVAGDLSDAGYICIGLKKRVHKAHRLAWLHVHGALPEGPIDHINRVRNDNRIENLRDTTPRVNAENASMRPDNKSGIRGVCWHKKSSRWMVQTGSKYVGIFKNFEDAVMARWFSEELMFESCSL